jgi:hypothetical protein
MVQGQDAFEYIVDHSLMRPRFLINIVENMIANAINRGHEIADATDCIDAVRQHSYYLVDDFGYEIRDVSGLDEGIFYYLVGVPPEEAHSSILRRLMDGGLTEAEAQQAIGLLLWYGVLGVTYGRGLAKYIYDFDYNVKRLKAEISELDDPTYAINPALHVGLAS